MAPSKQYKKQKIKTNQQKHKTKRNETNLIEHISESKAIKCIKFSAMTIKYVRKLE